MYICEKAVRLEHATPAAEMVDGSSPSRDSGAGAAGRLPHWTRNSWTDGAGRSSPTLIGVSASERREERRLICDVKVQIQGNLREETGEGFDRSGATFQNFLPLFPQDFTNINSRTIAAGLRGMRGNGRQMPVDSH